MDELIRFHAFYSVSRSPMRADAAALGSIPTRAFRYCEPIRIASAFGWYIFPALNFSLLWESEGDGLLWRCSDIAELAHWQPLNNSIQLPGHTASFDAAAPNDVRGFSLPWLTRMREPGYVQIWSGLVARTRSDTGLLVRPVANLPRSGGYEVFEGILETDRWFGPLFSNVRLTRSDCPVEFQADWPIAQVQAIQRSTYSDAELSKVAIITGLDKLTPEDWNDFRRTIVVPNQHPNRPLGENAVERRRRERDTSMRETGK